MSNRRDFYFRQKVTEAELDDAFNELETAERYLASDLGLTGIAVGMVVAQQASPNLTVQVSGPGVVYDQTGQRVAIPSTQNVNCAVDEGAINTAVVTPGNSRILSLFIEFDRTLSDPRVDGNSNTVYFVRAEGYAFNVVAGTENVSPSAPALRSDQILLADITLVFGQTTIVTGDISTTRREWMFKTTSGISVLVGSAEEAIQALATAISAVAAANVSFSPTGGIAATNVQTAIAELDTEKFAKTGGALTGGMTLPAANEYAYTTARVVEVVLNQTDARENRRGVAGAWVMSVNGEWSASAGDATEFKLFYPLNGQLPRGCTFDRVQVDLDQTDASGSLYDIGYFTSGGTGLVWTAVATSVAITNSGGINTGTLSFTAHQMLDTKQYYVRIRSDAGQVAGLTIYEVRVRCNVTNIKT